MPAPAPSDVALYRAALRDVNTLAQRDLLRTFRGLQLTDPDKVKAGLFDVLPDVVSGYHLAASTVAADWYDLERSKAGVKKRFQAVMPPAPKKSRSEVLVRWGVGPYYARKPDDAAESLPGGDTPPLLNTSEVAADLTLSKIAGGLSRIVLDGARQTIVGSAGKDPARVKWGRVTDGNACAFCTLLAGRGFVYTSDSADFDSHDKCGCSAVPEF